MGARKEEGEKQRMENEGLFRIMGTKDRLVDRVIAEMERSIIEGKLGAGMRLPPERELAQQMGVSRTVLREATQTLVTIGLLETKRGVGTVVQQMNLAHLVQSLSLMLRMQGISLDNLHQVRLILELENAKLAATQATQSDITYLKRVLGQMEEAMADPQAFADLDAEFHTAISKTAHNPLLTVLLDSIRDLMQNIRLTVSQYPDLFKTVMPDHYQILDRIIDRDAKGAREAMQQHLEHARRIQELFLAQQQSERSLDNTPLGVLSLREQEVKVAQDIQPSGPSKINVRRAAI
jgi:GntR family transcriptional regulator, transcriptional repressor for pyruvate dehydrogenase complex